MAKRPDISEQLRQAVIACVAAGRFPVPLGDVFLAVKAKIGGVTLGQFHDALRDLAAASMISLSPWTGAMYQIRDPECCLILGREIMAYAETISLDRLLRSRS
jgi:hypothetical protein